MCTRFLFRHKLVYHLVVNIPFLVIRCIIWGVYDKHVSVFLVKNVLGIGFAFQHLHEVLVEAAESDASNSVSVGLDEVRRSDVVDSDTPAGDAEPRGWFTSLYSWLFGTAGSG